MIYAKSRINTFSINLCLSLLCLLYYSQNTSLYKPLVIDYMLVVYLFSHNKKLSGTRGESLIIYLNLTLRFICLETVKGFGPRRLLPILMPTAASSSPVPSVQRATNWRFPQFHLCIPLICLGGGGSHTTQGNTDSFCQFIKQYDEKVR